MASKNVRIGSLIVTEDKSGHKRVSIGLGNKGKDPKYNVTVELIARDASGKIVARQTDGFVNLVDPRTQPDELLQKGLITAEVAAEMKEKAAYVPEKIKYQLHLSRV